MTDSNGVALAPSVEAGVVNALQHECGETSAAHGFKDDWHIAARLEEFADSFSEGEHKKLLIDAAVVLRNNILGMKLALIHSEISEALKSLRKNGGAQGSPVTVYIDNVRLVVPEPATFGLLAIGAVMVGAAARRRGRC